MAKRETSRMCEVGKEKNAIGPKRTNSSILPQYLQHLLHNSIQTILPLEFYGCIAFSAIEEVIEDQQA